MIQEPATRSAPTPSSRKRQGRAGRGRHCRSRAKRSPWIHYGAFNRTRSLEERDKLNFVSAEIFEPNQGGRIARELDRHFAAAPVPTLTLEDRVQTAANVGRFRALLSALDFVSYLILLVVLSILGTMIVAYTSVVQRRTEIGVLRRELCHRSRARVPLPPRCGRAAGLGARSRTGRTTRRPLAGRARRTARPSASDASSSAAARP